MTAGPRLASPSNAGQAIDLFLFQQLDGRALLKPGLCKSRKFGDFGK
jgi:hypothetical protein